MTPHDSVAAIKAFCHAIKGDVVSPEEVRRRSGICETCPKRERVSKVKTQVSKFLGMVASRYRVSSDTKDYCCGVCHCSLLLLLPATKEDLHVDSAEESAARPETCWMKNL